MLARIRTSNENKGDKGFTLIELLVVVIIIGILSAIAIPTFLKQREKAWDKAATSDLRNNALKMEEYLDDMGTYPITGDVQTGDYAFKASDNVGATTVKSTTRVATGYCIEAVSTKIKVATGALGEVGGFQSYFLTNTAGKPAKGVCP